MIADLRDQNKPITFDEFLEIVVGRLGDVKTREGLQKLFNLYDTDGSGTLDFEKLKSVGKDLGETLNDD
jgi:Ca2+-binding EF-hand superfamily protein